MWQLTAGIELHELIQKLILEVLAIQASSGAVERLFSHVTYDARVEETVCLQKTWKFWFKMSKMKIKLSKFFFYCSEKYTIIHENIRFFLKYTNTRNGFCKYTIHEKLDTRQFTGRSCYLYHPLT